MTGPGTSAPPPRPTGEPPRVVVLVSGRGSNLRSIVADRPPCEFAAVISNRPDAGALQFAHESGIPTRVVDHRAFPDRPTFEAALADAIDGCRPALVVLAGFMRILGADFVERYQGRMINIHPSLLPAYTGLHTHRRALADGVRVHGCTVHFVTPTLDCGPIIAQATVPVLPGDDEDTLAARVLAQEHRLYPQVVRAFVEGRLVIEGGCVRVDGVTQPDRETLPALRWPPLGDPR
jgi:phosphoribosylglycinamide formyltransferase-1